MEPIVKSQAQTMQAQQISRNGKHKPKHKQPTTPSLMRASYGEASRAHIFCLGMGADKYKLTCHGLTPPRSEEESTDSSSSEDASDSFAGGRLSFSNSSKSKEARAAYSCFCTKEAPREPRWKSDKKEKEKYLSKQRWIHRYDNTL